jgi:hypothetical protein
VVKDRRPDLGAKNQYFGEKFSWGACHYMLKGLFEDEPDIWQ